MGLAFCGGWAATPPAGPFIRSLPPAARYGRGRRLLIVSALHELEEPALLSLAGFVLIEECQFPVVEGLEELIPLDVLEPVGMSKLNSQNAFTVLAFGAFDHGGPAFPRLHPAADLVVIRRCR